MEAILYITGAVCIWVVMVSGIIYLFDIESKKILKKKHQKTIEQYNRVPKVNHYLLALLLFLLIAFTGKAQVFAELGAGMTNKYFSAELQAGYRLHNITASAGYIALPKDDQPVLFNLRAGYMVTEKLQVYGGYVRVMRSSDVKSMNSNSWQVGAQWHFINYDKGSVYISPAYTGNGMLSVHVGMAYNLLN